MASGMDTLVFDITRHASGIVNTILDVKRGKTRNKEKGNRRAQKGDHSAASDVVVSRAVVSLLSLVLILIFSVHCLRLVDVGREYIKVIKGDLQHFFMLDFNNQAMNRFIEHQMLTSFKEFRADCHTHFKKYSDPEEARANPSHMLINQMLERYLKLFWIDDRATKKVLVEDPSSSPIRWPVLVVPQPCVRNSR
ncbi:CACTA en-spm transposon protein [Cucumis melo var. makuwa]|uniref:CACTA en-spm transposon protein n=1 Tax=Cucumis melo var. makuwa TaxID=1194695 RepID=A0A5D3DIF0_CUCMM|nr:CACTA en-spm transposon protein [Cucumis melo var. makuwa]